MGFENLLLGFSVAITPFNLGVAVIGVVLGTIIGVLPGLGGANGVAILLPLTFRMPPTSAIILLTSLYWGALFGGAITSILFNIPGEPWSVATTFDGHPMARAGKSGQALTAAFSSSFVGAFFSTLLITFFAPLLADVALHFGPPEFFAIQLLTFSAFIGLGGGSPAKSLVSVVIGLLLAAVGLDTVTGQLRLTFGLTPLITGFDFIVAVIGLFGLGEIFLRVEEGLKFEGPKAGINRRVVLETWKDLPRYWRTFLRGCLIGFWMGFKPGGATPASFMSYAFAKRFSKHPERFGKGDVEGVVAPETAAHAAGVAAILPMITLGIPGSPTAAVMLGGLVIWGLQPGPLLFKEQPAFVWGLIASMYTGNLIGVILVLAFVPLFAAILRIPFAILTPFIVVLCAIGAYAVHSNLSDVLYVIPFGIVGYVFKKLDYPLAPMVLALVLGDMAESAFRQSLIMSQGTLLIFFERPISGAIATAAVALFLYPVLAPAWHRFRHTAAPPPPISSDSTS
jgi:putative tricarboxylic transport membrane protein